MPTYTVECECGYSETIVLPLSQFGDWPFHCKERMTQRVCAPNLMPDIQAFRSIATDIDSGKNPIINTRSQLKDFERRNKCHQVGDDVRKAPKPWTPMPSVRKDLGKVVHEVLSKENKRGR